MGSNMKCGQIAPRERAAVFDYLEGFYNPAGATPP